MPTSKNVAAFVIIFFLLLIASFVLVLFDHDWSKDVEWASRAVEIVHNLGGMVLVCIAVTTVLVEGGNMVLAKVFIQKDIKKAEQRIRDRAIEADRSRKDGETLKDALERVERTEKENP